MGPIRLGSGAERHILLITCGFSKFVSGTVLNDLQSTTIAKGLLNCHILIHGCPEQIITDQGSSINSSKVIKELYDVLSIDKVQTSPYHPQANLTENRNKTVKQILSKLVTDNPDQWPKYLQTALFSYNNTVNKSTGFSPGYLFYGRNLRKAHVYFGTTTQYFRDEIHYAYTLYWELRRVYGVVQLQESLQAQQERGKRYYDKRSRRTHYREGDCVAVYMPLPASQLNNNKFKTRLRVLFQIIKVTSDQN